MSSLVSLHVVNGKMTAIDGGGYSSSVPRFSPHGSLEGSDRGDVCDKTIVVAGGGVSMETSISIQSALACEEALRNDGLKVVRYDHNGNVGDFVSFLKQYDPTQIIVFNAFHGYFGEDGGMQALLNILNIPYTHSGLEASLLCMDKLLSKAIITNQGLSTPQYVVSSMGDIQQRIKNVMTTKKKQISIWPYERFVIKPVAGGSSLATVALRADTIPDPSVYETLSTMPVGTPMMIEEFVVGQEITVAVLDGVPLAVTGISHDGIYDYHTKYHTGLAQHCCPAVIPSTWAIAAKNLAGRVYSVMGCRGVARIDMIIPTQEGGNDDVTNAATKGTTPRMRESNIAVIEVNTNPGLTTVSLVPEQANHVGISFPQLLRRLLKAACFDSSIGTSASISASTNNGDHGRMRDHPDERV